MKPTELYELETGDKKPSDNAENLLFWKERYRAWALKEVNGDIKTLVSQIDTIMVGDKKLTIHYIADTECTIKIFKDSRIRPFEFIQHTNS